MDFVSTDFDPALDESVDPFLRRKTLPEIIVIAFLGKAAVLEFQVEVGFVFELCLDALEDLVDLGVIDNRFRTIERTCWRFSGRRAAPASLPCSRM
jgi:hypothetical protein